MPSTLGFNGHALISYMEFLHNVSSTIMTPVIIGCGTPVPGPLRSGPLKMENEKVVLIFGVNKNQILKQKYFILIYFCTKSSFAVISI